MPARYVIVHDDPERTNALSQKLGPNVASFGDPTIALMALEAAKNVTFLITRLQVDDRQPIGLSLARLARSRRPDVRVIFTGQPHHRRYARGLGEFIPEPVEPSHVGLVPNGCSGMRPDATGTFVAHLIETASHPAKPQCLAPPPPLC
jgi:hypothetical protein